MHTPSRSFNRMEDLERVRQGEIRFRTDEEISPREFFTVRRQNSASIGTPRLFHVLRVVEKAEVLRRRRIEWLDPPDLEITVTDDLGAQLCAEVRETNSLAHWVVLKR